ncbi:MAG: hypothetical protein V7L13_07825 [Nostoc sp.]|uniref:hypothetical protein n=2 Tax=Nostoc sp. TaxID=1180 RepID=UPI002FFCE9C0
MPTPQDWVIYLLEVPYSVPWKRGILFIGSPENGKTHTVKALMNQMRQPCLYVKSFKSEYATDSETMGLFEQGVSQIVALTEGFSFAYLKELFLSSMIRWMGDMETGALEKIMISQVAILREQMSSTTVSAKDLEK